MVGFNAYKQVLVLITMFLAFNLVSQTEQKKLRLGLNIGVYQPSKSYAQFLDGSHPTGVSTILNDPFIRPQLEELFGYSIINWTYPANMRYNVSLYTGGYFALRLDEDFAFTLNTNITKTNINQVILIKLDNPKNIQGEFEQASVTARERRLDVLLGIENEFNEYQGLEFYGGLGGLFNYIKLEQQEFVVRNSMRYSIMRTQFIGGQGQRQNYQGFGYGFFGNIGTRYLVSEKYTLDLGIELNLTQNRAYVKDLAENTGYSAAFIEQASKFKLNGNAYFRIIWN